jgi:hypothetical protein
MTIPRARFSLRRPAGFQSPGIVDRREVQVTKHRVESISVHRVAEFLDEAVADGWEVLGITGDVAIIIVVLAREE